MYEFHKVTQLLYSGAEEENITSSWNSQDSHGNGEKGHMCKSYGEFQYKSMVSKGNREKQKTGKEPEGLLGVRNK